jgi:methylation protein EvaC
MNALKSSPAGLSCRICGEATLRPFLDLGTMPIANAFLSSEQLSQPEYTFWLQAGFCESCLMVQLVEAVDPNMLFHDHYAYFSSISRVMDEHFDKLARRIGAEILYDKRLPVVEIGANDGILLQKLAAYSPRAIGIEPSANVAVAAREKGLHVISEFFNTDLAASLRAEHGPAQLVVGANVLCHIPDQNGVARALETLLDAEGVFIFEDPYLLEIMTQLAYDQIYDEHVYYFSVTSLRRLFEKHGLRIFRVEPIPVHGGSMRVYGCRSACSRAVEPSVTAQLAAEREYGLTLLQTYLAFAERVQQSRASLIELLRGLHADGARVVGYAASSKGTVILNYCGIGPQMLEYVCDNTPSKHGFFTPGTHIPIVPIDRFAADYPNYAFVLAWNHLNEIASKEQTFREQGGQFITHIPTARIA